METRNKKLVMFVFVLIALSSFFIFLNLSVYQKNVKPLQISFLDIGQGDATFIEAPSGAQMLIDGGPPDGNVIGRLQEVMPFFDYSIDVVLATHADADHIGGISSVIDRYGIDYVIQNGQEGDTQMFQQLQSAIQNSVIRTKTKSKIARRGDLIVLDKKYGVFLFVLHPDGSHFAKDTNDNSIILKLVYGNSSVILTGDAPSNVEKMLVYKDGVYLQSDILKAGHHGSKTSSSAEFINTVRAPLSIISAGIHNKYGHPHQEVVDRLKSISTILTTFDLGTIRFESDGNSFHRDQ